MRFQLKQIAIAGMLTCLGASAMATNYFYIQPKSGEMSKVAPFTVALDAATLPSGIVGMPYNAGAGFDLAPLAHIGGDATLNQSLVTFAVTSGSLPAGISLSPVGKLTGTPTEPTTGTTIQVTAAYKNVNGAQSYTFAVVSPNVLGTFALPNLTVGGAAYSITPPSSLSPGAFTYTSSNTAVATISGATISAIAVGTTTVTATQAAAGNYAEASTSVVINGALPIAHTTNITPNNAFTIPTGAANISGNFSYSTSSIGRVVLKVVGGADVDIANCGPCGGGSGAMPPMLAGKTYTLVMVSGTFNSASWSAKY